MFFSLSLFIQNIVDAAQKLKLLSEDNVTATKEYLKSINTEFLELVFNLISVT